MAASVVLEIGRDSGMGDMTHLSAVTLEATEDCAVGVIQVEARDHLEGARVL
jgi:hypothetical protein